MYGVNRVAGNLLLQTVYRCYNGSDANRQPLARPLPTRPSIHQSLPAHVRQAQRQQQDAQRGTSCQRGYDARWQKARLAYLREHPLCECDGCKLAGIIRPSEVVDHVIPHCGDQLLFWDERNWKAMAKSCHDRKTATSDGGFGSVRKGGG